jgi:hypothetical protein
MPDDAGMNLTPAQLQTLATDLADNVNTVLVAGVPTAINAVAHSPDNAVAVAAWYNLAAVPSFRVYRSAVPMKEIMLNGFDWTRVDNLSVGKARIWEWMTEADPFNRAIDPSKPNVRSGINSVWVGTAADLAVRAAVYVHCHRAATNAERLYVASGAGTAPDQAGDGPGTLAVEGILTASNVDTAWNLPPA